MVVRVLVKSIDGVEWTTLTRQYNGNVNNVGLVRNNCSNPKVDCHNNAVPKITVATPTGLASSHMLNDADLGMALLLNASPASRHYVAMPAYLAACRHRDDKSTEDGINANTVNMCLVSVDQPHETTLPPSTGSGRRERSRTPRQCIEAGNDTATNQGALITPSPIEASPHKTPKTRAQTMPNNILYTSRALVHILTDGLCVLIAPLATRAGRRSELIRPP